MEIPQETLFVDYVKEKKLIPDSQQPQRSRRQVSEIHAKESCLRK